MESVSYIWQPPTGEGFEPYKALYIHIPFCKQRCGYCDFATAAVAHDDARIDEYLDNLVLQIRRASKADLLGQLETVYIGGGTPSHIGNKRLGQLLYTLSLSMHLTPEVECTLEANPESLTEAMVKDLFALGVTRLSLGMQSLHDETLKRLGRVHTADDARRAIHTAQERFTNISADVMCGLPGQTTAEFIEDVHELVKMGISHISVYPLVVEEDTPFARLATQGEIPEDNEDEAAEMMQAAAELLPQLGFHRYEVASYAREGFECKHNKAYWSGKPYMGLGEGAVGMMQNATSRVRYSNGEVVERLNRAEYEAEDLMLGMRMAEGISEERLATALAYVHNADMLFDNLALEGFVQQSGGRIRPTHKGWLFGNQMYARIMDLPYWGT